MIGAGQETTETSGVSPPAGPGEGGRHGETTENRKDNASVERAACEKTWRQREVFSRISFFFKREVPSHWEFSRLVHEAGIFAFVEHREEDPPFVDPVCLWVGFYWLFFGVFWIRLSLCFP